MLRIITWGCFLTLVLSFVVTASAQTKTLTGMYETYLKAINVPEPSLDSVGFDRMKIKFLRNPRISVSAQNCAVQLGDVIGFQVVGVVSPEIDLSNDLTAQQIIQMGIQFGREQCPPKGENFRGKPYGRVVSVTLYSGEPSKYNQTNIIDIGQKRLSNTWWHTPTDTVSGVWASDKPGLIVNYTNHVKAYKLSLAYDAAKEKQRLEEAERTRLELEKQQAEIAARWQAFVKRHRIAYVVTVDQLLTNPFIYKGKVVAIRCGFGRMHSATQGIFAGGAIVVSGIPSSRFTQSGSEVWLVGMVLGNIESKPGSNLVPHLKYVGSAFCQNWNCSDYR